MDVSASGNWSDKQDVFAFVYEWAWRIYEAYVSNCDMNKPEFSLVHENLTDEPDFCTADGYKITALALKCVNRDESERPNMKQVSRSLNKLEVVKAKFSLSATEQFMWIVRRGPNRTYWRIWVFWVIFRFRWCIYFLIELLFLIAM